MTILAWCVGLLAVVFLGFCWLAVRVDKADPQRRERIERYRREWSK